MKRSFFDVALHRKRSIVVGLFCALLLAPAASSQEIQIKLLQPRGGKKDPVKAAPGSKRPVDDAVNLVFLGDKQPVLLRFKILVDGKTPLARWNDYIEQWFRYLDVDDDGGLDANELTRAPHVQVMAQLALQGYFFSNGVSSKLEKKGDKFSLADLREYYAQAMPQALVVPQANNSVLYNAASNQLFKALDLNHDGKLSKDEILAAAKTLRKFDLDDDEWVTLQELSGGSTPAGNGLAFVQRSNIPTGSISDAFFQIRAGDNRLPLLLLARYDREKTQKLSQKDLGLDDEAFAKLDANKDGSLDLEELAGWHQRSADLEFTIRLGKNKGVDLREPARAFSEAVKQTAPNTYQMTLEDAQINLVGTAAERGGGMVIVGRNQGFLQLFRLADPMKNGFVEMKDLNSPQFQFLRMNFKMLDRDGDGKLTDKELQKFLELQDGAAAGSVTISLGEEGRALFQLLDANRDGRLSRRELLNAWTRLEPLDKDKKGFVVPGDLIRQFHINVGRGGPNNFNQFVLVGAGFNPGMPAARPVYPAGVPDWFRKMDKNADGDVSLAEFLGTRADFDRIDTDHDGLISAEEAMRFDQLMRKEK